MARRQPDFAARRAAMVKRQLAARDIHDTRVLATMGEVPREKFIPDALARSAYADGALPIGHGQTISQPWVVATICQSLRLTGQERVLEVGTGSGYSAAILARLAAKVFSIERVPELAAQAQEQLAELGAENVEVIVADGSLGLSAQAPFEGIAVHATAPAPPESLLAQLAEDGRLVAPVYTGVDEVLTLFERRPGEEGLLRTPIAPCRFVPLLGGEGFEPRD